MELGSLLKTSLKYIIYLCILDYHCVECENNFNAASLLLKHFAEHAISTEIGQNIQDKTAYQDTRSTPDLFPINLEICWNQNDSDSSSDSEVEDVNPIKFCLVTLEDTLLRNSTKKFLCSYCQKRFSWSTDLKRHILTHIGK